MKKSQKAKGSDSHKSDSPSRSGDDASPTRIVGFDPGLNITGYGVIEVLPDQHVRLVEAGTIRPKSKDDIEKRLHAIHSGVCEILETFSPQSMAIEQLFVHVRFPKTAILMGHTPVCTMMRGLEKSLAPIVAAMSMKWNSIVAKTIRSTKALYNGKISRHTKLRSRRRQTTEEAMIAFKAPKAICNISCILDLAEHGLI